MTGLKILFLVPFLQMAELNQYYPKNLTYKTTAY